MIFSRLASGFAKLKDALNRTRSNFFNRISSLFQGPLDEIKLEELETILFEADLGREVASSLTLKVKETLQENPKLDQEALIALLKKELLTMMPEEKMQPFTGKPHVILVVGVNGAGKTTSIAKLAHYFKEEGKSVLVAAADTFRAAAVDQLVMWCDRAGVPIVKGKPHGDPAAVAFDALSSAKAKGIDVVLIDTAGRLENKTHLMHELDKIRRACSKIEPKTPQDTWLVVDATTGQTGLSQATSFHSFTPLTGVVLTKLDGSAKGGVVVSIRKKLGTPVRFIGVGEGMHDLQPFNCTAFVDAFFGTEKE